MSHKSREWYAELWGDPEYFTKLIFNRGGVFSRNVNTFWGHAAKPTHIRDRYGIFIDSLVEYLEAKVTDRQFEHWAELVNAGWRPKNETGWYQNRRAFLDKYLFGFSRKINARIADALNTGMPRRTLRILDMGSGLSVLYDILHKNREIEYLGIDISEKLLHYSYAPQPFRVCGEVEERIGTLIAGGQFDCIVDCLCTKDLHIYPKNPARTLTESPDYKLFLGNVNRALKPGGWFLHIYPLKEYAARHKQNPKVKSLESYLSENWVKPCGELDLGSELKDYKGILAKKE